MFLRRTARFRVLSWGLGSLVLGCQAPNLRPTAPSQNLHRPASRASSPNVPLAPRRSVLAGIQPADSLQACHPRKGQRDISLTRFLEDLPTPAKPMPPGNQFEIPGSIPGADAPPVTVPEKGPNVPFETHRREVQTAYKTLPPLPEFPFTPADNLDERIALAELQAIAYRNSPLLAAAAARVEQARGTAIQAGLYPNPETGYEADTVNTAATAGYHGVFASQTIVTADKLKIAQSAACQDVAAAEWKLRRVEIDLATAVRRNYFQALIAQERLKFVRGLADLFQRSYEAQIDLVAGGESAAYEPLQLRVFALEARNTVVQASNDYVAAWRQLAAVLNSPQLTARELDGTPEMSVPEIPYENALEILLSRHTDLEIAQTQINKSEYNLWLQQVTPIPNVNLYGAVQYDDTSPLDDVTFNLQVGLPLPVFNKNQGNIYNAQSQIVENHQNLAAAQNDLTARLAEVYGRYSTNRVLAQTYREEILPDQVRMYRGVYQRFREGADTLDFSQVIVTQQQLQQVVGAYVTVLQAQWQAVVDLAELLQADELYSLDHSEPQPADLPRDAKPLLLPTPNKTAE